MPLLTSATPALLVLAVAAVGVFHTLVPDHWVPIALVARKHGWTRSQTARAAAIAGLGHTVSTLIIAIIVWYAGVVFAERFGRDVDIVTSALLFGFGAWVVIGAVRELRESPPAHSHLQPTSSRTALLLIVGSSPMVEGIPAFFAASRYGIALIAVMSIVFAVSTIATYVGLCVASASGLQRMSFGPLERYGEILSGAIIMALGIVFIFLR
jgi:putative Mn2+ efflux pump MntP